MYANKPAWMIHVMLHGCGVLPKDAERELMRASKVGTSGSRERRRAIDRAYDLTSRNYPTMFKD